MTINDLPVYQALINIEDETTGMFVISLVDEPAVEADFVAFDKDKKPLQFKVEDEEQRMVFGLVMAADMPIYRRTDDGFEYYITYSPETIRIMAEKYFKEGRQNNVDTDHNFKLEDGVTMVQMFIKDSEGGINPAGFEDYKDGSLFAQFHIENDEVWEAVKDGTYKGFSLAGTFELEKLNKIIPNKEDNKTMTKLNRVKEMLKAMLEVFGDVATDKGTLIYDGDEEIKVGDAVKLLDGENNEIDAEDGEYITDDKRKIVVAEGKVESIEDIEEEEPATEDAPAEEPAQEEMSAQKQAFTAIKVAFEQTYEEKYNKIYEAIKAQGIEYFYIVEASDEYAIVSVWEEDDTEHYYKFDLSWSEDGEVTASNQIEVKRTYVPIDEEPEQEEPSSEEAPAEEPAQEEPEAQSAALSAQEQFAALENEPVKATKSNKKIEEMRRRGYKI